MERSTADGTTLRPRHPRQRLAGSTRNLRPLHPGVPPASCSEKVTRGRRQRNNPNVNRKMAHSRIALHCNLVYSASPSSPPWYPRISLTLRPSLMKV